MAPPAAARTRPLLRDPGVLAGLGVLGLVVVTDLWTATLLTATYTASAIVASMLTDARRTALVAVAGVALAFGLGYLRDEPGSTEWLLRASLGSALAGLAVTAAHVRDHREESLRRMTLIAATAQQALLSSLPEQVEDVALAARYVSATHEALVGGDLYEVVPTQWGVRLVVGDVRGKGIEAVQVAAAVLSAFRHTAGGEADLAGVARRLDATIRRLLGEEDFVTAVLVELDGDRLTVASCGHPAPVLVTDATTLLLEPVTTSPPLGLGADPTPTTHLWAPEARLLLYTDGLVEARGRGRRFFPLEEVADGLARGTLDEALDGLVGALRRHTGDRLGDDLALVLVEHAGRRTT